MSSTEDGVFIVRITPSLISEVSGCAVSELGDLQTLNLWLKSKPNHKIRAIEALHHLSSLKALNLSYNIISRIQGLDRLMHLVDLNLSQNCIKSIEGVEHLKALEKLNLSGNQIQRIPASISALRSLAKFNISHNQLNTLEDIRFLGRLENLKNLMLLGNPIARDPEEDASRLFAIYHVSSLTSLNKDDVTQEERSKARQWYAVNELAFVRSELSAEEHHLKELRRDLQHSPERAAVLRPDRAEGVLSREAAVELDASNRSLAQRLKQIEAVEERMLALRARLRVLERGQPAPTDSPTTQAFQRLRSSVSTPSAPSMHPQTPRPAIPEDLAVQQIQSLTAKNERLAGLLLTSEKKKEAMQHELDVHRSVRKEAGCLQHELTENEERLGEALRAAQEAHSQLQARDEELTHSESAIIQRDHKLASQEADISLLQQETDNLRKELMYFKSEQHQQRSSAKEDWRTHEIRAETMKQRLAIEELESKNNHLMQELDERLRQAAQLTDTMVKAQQEAERCKSKARQDKSDAQRRIDELEEENKRNRHLVDEMTNDITVLQAERDQFQASLRRAEYDLQALMKAKRTSPAREPRSASRSGRFARDPASYFEVASTDSEDPVDADSPVASGRRHRTARSPRHHSLAQSLSTLERKAGEIMAHILLEEVKQSRIQSVQTASTKSDALKEACIRTVLRLTSAAHSPEDLGGDGVTPFHMLGNRDFLSRLVAETHANMVGLEDAQEIKQEVSHLESIVRELERKAESLESSVVEKQRAVQALERQAAEAKKLSETTLSELEQMAQRLRSHRDEVSHLLQQKDLAARELQVSNTALQEIECIRKQEQDMLQSAKDRNHSIKQERAKLEQELSGQKNILQREEHKWKLTKAAVQDEIQSLQQELNNLQSSFKMKQHSIEELETVRRRLDEDVDAQRQGVYQEKLTLAQQIGEEGNRLNQLKGEVQSTQRLHDQAQTRLRQMEADLRKVQEANIAETNRFDFIKLENMKKLEGLERQAQHLENQLKSLKEKKLHLDNDSILLQHSVEDLRRQQHDLEKTKESRSRSAEGELTTLLAQIQKHQRSIKQIALQSEQKQHELEVIVHDCQVADAQLMDKKKTLQAQDTAIHQQKELLGKLEYDSDCMQKNVSLIRKEMDSLRSESASLKLQIQSDQSQFDDLRRRIHALKQEEDTHSNHQNKIKTSLQGLQQQLYDLRTEHDQLVGAKDRDTFVIKELNHQKLQMENEINRLNDMLVMHKERASHDHLRKDEADAQVMQAVEEKNRLLKEVMQMEAKLRDADDKLRHYDQQEVAHKASLQKVSFETAAMREHYHKEKLLLDKLRDELRDAQLALSRSREEMSFLEQEVTSRKMSAEQAKMQHGLLEQQKATLGLELLQIKETAARELKRIDHLEDTYSAVDKRLSKLREEMVRAEGSIEQTRSISKEESLKRDHYQDLIATSIAELQRLERSIEEARDKLNDERRRAVEEIGLLDQAKVTAQTHIARTADLQRKMDSRNNAPTAMLSVGSLAYSRPQKQEAVRRISPPAAAAPVMAPAAPDFHHAFDNSGAQNTEDSADMPNTLQRGVDKLRTNINSAWASMPMKGTAAKALNSNSNR